MFEAMATTTLAVKRQRIIPDNGNFTNSLVDEKVLVPVFRATNWNPFMLCLSACVCKKLSCIAKRILWKEFCVSRAPKMACDLLTGGRNGHVDGGWDTLGKVMCYCTGCYSTSHLDVKAQSGHLVEKSRFSQKSGKSFLVPQCREDVLYVSDPCEHADDIGLFRGVFRGFGKSLTRRMLIERRVKLDEKEICPYCRAKVWSMSRAKMVPKSAGRRLGANDGDENVEYFLCLFGHLSGQCVLISLSDSEGACGDTEQEDESEVLEEDD